MEANENVVNILMGDLTKQDKHGMLYIDKFVSLKGLDCEKVRRPPDKIQGKRLANRVFGLVNV